MSRTFVMRPRIVEIRFKQNCILGKQQKHKLIIKIKHFCEYDNIFNTYRKFLENAN